MTALTQGMTMFDAALTMQAKYMDFWAKSMMPFASASRPKTSQALTKVVFPNPVVPVEDSLREQVMAVGEEVLKIDKQIIPGDTTRIIRTVVNAPVEEQVELLTETVIVERRKPNGDASADDLLSERTMQMTATTERPIVTKTRRVVEEVVLRAETTAHVETIRNTVKRDKIDIEAPNRVPAVIAAKDENRRDKQHNRA